MAGSMTEPITYTDPVCLMEIEEQDSVGTVDHDGVTYHFCAEICIERFKENPGAYLSGERPEMAAPEVADGPQSVILTQVENGVAVRMAVLYAVAASRGLQEAA